jgi:hypothetical protein
MTRDSFVRTIKALLLANKEIHWNSVHELFLADLGRRHERESLSIEEILGMLKQHFTYTLTRDLERQIEKTLR